MKQELTYIEGETILVRKVLGRMNLNEVIQSWKELIVKEKLRGDVKGVINDTNASDLDVSIEELEELYSFFRTHLDLFGKIKLAVVTERPRNIILPLYAEKKFPEFKIHAFSTYKSAIAWIKMEN